MLNLRKLTGKKCTVYRGRRPSLYFEGNFLFYSSCKNVRVNKGQFFKHAMSAPKLTKFDDFFFVTRCENGNICT